MAGKVKKDNNPKNDYSDGYNAGRRYFTRIINKLLNSIPLLNKKKNKSKRKK